MLFDDFDDEGSTAQQAKYTRIPIGGTPTLKHIAMALAYLQIPGFDY